MNRTATAAAILVVCGAFAQSTSFEVAAITPCPSGTQAPAMEHAGIADFILPGGRFTARATTVKFLMEWAYGIQPAQHSDGPSRIITDWLGSDRFDIVAKAEGNASEDEIKLMVRSLLADRFHLTFHRERREVSLYVISQGKTTPKLFPPKPEETHALRFAPHTDPDQKVTTFRIVARRFSLAQLADAFARQLGSVMLNETGLNDEYDFTLDLTPDDSGTSPMDPTFLIAAMREQLGLTVKYQKAPVDFYVIDGAEKVTAGQ